MIFHEFGKEGEEAVLLIHGFGCNAEKSFAIPSAILCRKYRVITVDLDGQDIGGQALESLKNLNNWWECQKRMIPDFFAFICNNPVITYLIAFL